MPHVPDVIAEEFAPPAVRIATRRYQKLVLSTEGDGTLYLVHKGVFLARATLPDARQQILNVLYPGDIAHARAMPALDGAAIAAASESGEIWRVRGAAVKTSTETNPSLSRAIADHFIEQAARLALHNAVLSGLNGDERVAALFIELTLRVGQPTPAGITFDMPLSRTDIADHLALNADTVSRIVSRMRSKALISMVGRNRIVCRDFEALAAECPLADALTHMHGSAKRRQETRSAPALTPAPRS
ncbi:Crp/Fnr family transcription regulator [Hyphomicrobium nitrativorans NL23]|uniref:Crp/Fnr family transcription regulator n=1 Tax=Hyphomicrobium nitrativorans NL23 TaxID=1029756 RepID=V5SDN8_9HYPH|nr:Crp/Fnr family transcriptional regulator [Hyphomicrobium nitrativorans]AHB48643.1 Crp/Fnr family transcription regulator [Hyphomicrobium nitrativorans NL23]